MFKLSIAVSALLCALVLACGGNKSDGLPSPTSEVSPTPGTSPSPIATTEPSAGEFPLLRFEAVLPGQTFDRMTGMYLLPDDRWLVTEQAGRVMLVDLVTSEVSLFLDVTDRVGSRGNEEGLLGLAIAPDYAKSREFYLYYTAISEEETILSRFTADPGGATAAADSEIRILAAEQLAANHNGGQLAFGPDAYLYLGLGDGGDARDPLKNGQNLGTIQGSVLRIDVSGGGPGYSVPPDNPFVGQAGAKGEIWAYGLRNPWRFSFDTLTGDLWLGDVGQDAREEVNFIVKGGNYGWSIMEGFDCLGGGSCNQEGLLLPVIDYGHDEGCAVTGGFVYHGSQIAGLQGAYLYADFCSGKVWALRAGGSKLIESALIGAFPIGISSFAQGNDGELYVLDYSNAGIIYELVP